MRKSFLSFAYTQLCSYPRCHPTTFLSFSLRAFAKYDVDGDGFISVTDLQEAFRAQGRHATTQELVAWVRKRDLSGIGAVAFEDFAKSYQ